MDLKITERSIDLDTSFPGDTSAEPIVRVRNRLGDKVWAFHEESDNLQKPYELDFSSFDDLEKRLVMQEILLFALSGGMGWADESNRLSVTSRAIAETYLSSCKRIYDWWSANEPDLSLASFGKNDIVRLSRAVLESRADDEGKPVYGVLKNIGKSINAANRYFMQGRISDGFVHQMSAALKRDIAEPLLKPFSISYPEWITSSSWGCIPVDVALTWFMEATDIIHSRETKILLAFFEAWRYSPPHSSDKGAQVLSLQYYRNYQRTGSWPQFSRKSSQRAWQSFGEKFDELGMADVEALPWQSIGELTSYCKIVRSACNALLHLVAGNRLHEVAEYQTDQWFEDTKGVWWYRSRESKVNKGANADRSIDPIGAEAASVLRDMSFLDPTDQRPLLGSSFVTGAMGLARKRKGLAFDSEQSWKEGRENISYGTRTVRDWFSDFYQTHLVAIHPEMGAKHSHAHPHQARHFWADVALRWIDPKYCDVIGKIREHYRHAGKEMVHSYTDGKRSDDIERQAEDRYMHEILERAAMQSPDDPWFGAATKRIRNEVASIDIFSPEELAEFVEAQSEMYSRFIVWEWGVCAVRIGEEAKANCADSLTGIPNLIATDRKMQPEICMGCVHQMAHKGFMNRIERIGIACQQRGIALENISPYLADALGFKPARKASSLLKGFE